ncbi:hypothetical protein [Pseudomonas alloputida]|uniref:hypothetical protein n=1 Tax=Pseudomonas alloputida TaxID=1940621 RepID=UPI001E337AFB|nr:hypothetical protein [Pseudomonas alloputida]MCE1053427.1 hypothetical protein [Pseudomonas alloputida]
MIGRHNVAKDELKKFKSLLNEYGRTPITDQRSQILLHDALSKLGATMDIILMDLQQLNEESPANRKPE